MTTYADLGLFEGEITDSGDSDGCRLLIDGCTSLCQMMDHMLPPVGLMPGESCLYSRGRVRVIMERVSEMDDKVMP